MVKYYPTQHLGHLLGKMMKEKMAKTIFQLLRNTQADFDKGIKLAYMHIGPHLH